MIKEQGSDTAEMTNEERNAEAAAIAAKPAEFEVVQEQKELFTDWIQVDDNGIEFNPKTPFEVWHSYTQGVLEFSRRGMRIAGQCLLFGEKTYGERYAQVIDAMRYNPKTLQNAVWVVSKIKDWHDALSFAHHDVVAALAAKAQDEMLTLAEKQALPVSKFKKMVREKYPASKTSKKPKKPAKVDIQDEAEVLQAANLVIAFLEAEEAKLAFRKWPETRLKKWEPIMSTLTKIARRSVMKTHGK